MEVVITGRHVDVTEPMNTHIHQRVNRLPRFDDKIQYLSVTLSMDSNAQHCEILTKCHRADLVAESRSHDMYESIDAAFGKIERRIARHHDKLVNRHTHAGHEASVAKRRPE